MESIAIFRILSMEALPSTKWNQQNLLKTLLIELNALS